MKKIQGGNDFISMCCEIGNWTASQGPQGHGYCMLRMQDIAAFVDDECRIEPKERLKLRVVRQEWEAETDAQTFEHIRLHDHEEIFGTPRITKNVETGHSKPRYSEKGNPCSSKYRLC